MRALPLISLAGLLGFVACDSDEGSREASSGQPVENAETSAIGNGTPAETSASAQSPVGGNPPGGGNPGAPIVNPTGNVNGGSSATTAKAADVPMEDCTKVDKAWRPAIVDPSNPQATFAAACADPLVDWCCTKDEIYARFPTVKNELEPHFALAENEHYDLYHCSSITPTGALTPTYTLHFAKQNGTDRYYHYTTIQNVEALKTGVTKTGACPQQLTTADITHP